MSLLNSVVGAITSAQGNGGGGADWMKIVGGLLSQPETGGLQGLVGAFASKGLGEVASSWVGKGANLPISAEQIMSVLGNQVQSMSANTGQNPEQLSSLLAQHLPGLVDKLTPDGAVPAQDPLSAGLGALKGLLR